LIVTGEYETTIYPKTPKPQNPKCLKRERWQINTF
jgi:hypothetical protein